MDKEKEIEKQSNKKGQKKQFVRANGTRPMLPPILSGAFLTGILAVLFILVMLYVLKYKI